MAPSSLESRTDEHGSSLNSADRRRSGTRTSRCVLHFEQKIQDAVDPCGPLHGKRSKCSRELGRLGASSAPSIRSWPHHWPHPWVRAPGTPAGAGVRVSPTVAVFSPRAPLPRLGIGARGEKIAAVGKGLTQASAGVPGHRSEGWGYWWGQVGLERGKLSPLSARADDRSLFVSNWEHAERHIMTRRLDSQPAQ